MGRLYSVSFDDISVSALQDLLNITATASMALRLHRVTGGQRSITVFEGKPIRIRRFPVTVTAGSGGSAVTPVPLGPNDPAATFTCRRNDTTRMTSSGTAVTLLTKEFEFLNGFDLVLLPQEEIIIRPSEGLSIELPTAPSGATSMSWTAIVEELF